MRTSATQGVEEVKIGKYIRLVGDVDLGAVTEMCEKLLANPVIEDFRIEIVGEG